MSKNIILTRRKLIVILAIVFLVASIPSALLYRSYLNVNDKLNNPAKIEQAKTDAYLKHITSRLLVPQNEKPSIATITDSSKLQAHPFFVNAKTGDQVIVYTNARRAILYRPNIGKVIEIAHLGVSQ